MPPRALKSYLCSVIFPLFFLARNPAACITVITYGEELSRPLAEQRRKILRSRLYRRLFPKVRLVRETAQEINTDQGGYILATSVLGPLTGRGGDLFVIDDPLKAGDAYLRTRRENVNDWFRNTLLVRPDDKVHAKILLVMQRLHADDPCRLLLNTDEFFQLAIPAIATKPETYELMHGGTYTREIGEVLRPGAEPLELLESMRREMTDAVFSAQYQQQPVPVEGGILKIRHLQRYQAPPILQPTDTVLQSWDTAFSESERADYSVGTTWLIRGDRYYLLELVRARLGFPALQTAVLAAKRRHPSAHILVEKVGSRTSLWQTLKERNVHVTPIKVEADKEVRAHQVTPILEADRIYLPRSAPWLDAFLDEIAAFPGNGTHDDQVDSFCQAINWWEQRKLRRPTATFGSY